MSSIPPWVYEKMFQQSQMYYFNDRDLALLETEISDELESSFSVIGTFMAELNKLVEANDQLVNQFVCSSVALFITVISALASGKIDECSGYLCVIVDNENSSYFSAAN